jgi:(S)-ureidoglycine aminohydrolase
VLARPAFGFAETFSHYLMEVAPGGGSATPETDPEAEAVLFVTGGTLDLEIDGAAHALGPGGYAYPAGRLPLGLLGRGFRPRDLPLDPQGLPAGGRHRAPRRLRHRRGRAEPGSDARHRRALGHDPLRRSGGPAHDMHVNIVTFEPGAVIPFAETHVMEHGLYVLEGKAVYRLNRDWVEVEAGDFMWLRAFCPQACYAGGPGRFRYLLYKDVNRHMPLLGARAL